MSSAEGEVQEKNYKASFPSLINVDGTPTYIMVLTDNGGLVKMYAMVNVEQYNLVVTAETQEEVFAKYRKLLEKEGKNSKTASDTEEKEDVISEITFVVADMEYITMEGETYVYIKDESGNVYKQKFSEDEGVIKISVGDTISIQYEEMENGIHRIITAELVKKGILQNGNGSGDSKAEKEEKKTVTGQDNSSEDAMTTENEPENGQTATEKTESEENQTTEAEDNSI